MFWITKYRNDQICKDYEDTISLLMNSLAFRDDVVEILDRITKKETSPFITADSAGEYCSFDVMAALDHSVPRYVEDYFGGKVIKQESTPVTILDENGKATYSQTAQKPSKDKSYRLVQF